jgi:hypothetical protein
MLKAYRAALGRGLPAARLKKAYKKVQLKEKRGYFSSK